MNSILDLLAVGSEIDFHGVKYKLREPTLDEQARFAQWLKDNAKMEAFRGDIPEEHRLSLARAAMQDIGERYYDPDSPGYVAALQKPVGVIKLFQIVFERDHPAITVEQVGELFQHGLKEVFAKLARAEIEDPKVLAGVLAILGFPPAYLEEESPKGSPNTNASCASDSETLPTTGSPGKSEG